MRNDNIMEVYKLINFMVLKVLQEIIMCDVLLFSVEEAVRLYCKEYFYEEAILLAQKEKRSESIEEIVDVSLGDGFATIAELVADCKGQLTSQLKRLRELRTKKAEEPYAFFGQIEDSDAADNVSVAPSETSTKESFFTRYTGKTGGIFCRILR